jgi:membrane-bound lytic murein transglycosylase B
LNPPGRPSPAPRLVPHFRAALVAVLVGAFAAAAQAAPEPKPAATKRAKPTPAKAKPATAKPATAAPAAVFADRADVRDFVATMVERHGFDAAELDRILAGTRFQPDVLRLISPAGPGFKRSWDAYRARFLDPLRIREGRRFVEEHREPLARAADQWGVPPEIVAAIIGVETIYGRVTGDFRVVDALATLAFEYPRRSEYFRSELEQFLLLARENGTDVFEPRGSFAGAIGLPQFMPGSIRRFAVDFDGSGRIDLSASPVDAIGSVARFLAEHGWVRGEPTHFRARIGDVARVGPLIDAGIEPRFTIAQLGEHGVGSPDEVPPDMPLALIDLPNADRPTFFVLGPRNFYAITRYNRSSFYAMAVIELSRELARVR